jgi:hypothetical protein
MCKDNSIKVYVQSKIIVNAIFFKEVNLNYKILKFY